VREAENGATDCPGVRWAERDAENVATLGAVARLLKGDPVAEQ
jgi:hypothetical protein